MRIIMSEWHQVERRMGLEITVDDVNDVYPDMTAEEVEQRYEELKSGEYAVEDFIGDAENQDIYFDWDWLDEDDWWLEASNITLLTLFSASSFNIFLKVIGSVVVRDCGNSCKNSCSSSIVEFIPIVPIVAALS